MKPTAPPSRETCVSILGCGWLGLPVAEKLIKSGHHVRGSTTRSSKLSVLSSLGLETLLMRVDPGVETGWTPTEATERFFDSKTMIVSLPPEAALGEEHFSSQIETILSRRGNPGFDHLLFISSTSVYGSKQGSVTEQSPLEPDTASGEILAKVEGRLSEAARTMKFGLTIVRPGGLIGPGRHPGLFLAGRKGVKDPSSPVNLIHQLDCAEAIAWLASEEAPPPGESRIYNLVSSLHPNRRDFYTTATSALGLQQPEFVAESPDAATKLVDSSKIRRHVKFQYDDLLASIGAKS